MKKTLSILLISLLVVIGFNGCSSKNRAYKSMQNNPHIDETINESIISLSNELVKTNRIKGDEKIAITSFVELHQLNKTTHFGRKLSESLFSELHKRGFTVIDARGTKTIRINADGEFFITRDIELLDKKRIENSYVFVGTYTRFGDGVMLNGRIIDNKSGEVVSAARTIIDINDCDLYENCMEVKAEVEGKKKSIFKEPSKPVKPMMPKVQKRMIAISDAGCSYVTCPENCVENKCYNKRKTTTVKPMVKETQPVKNSCGIDLR